MRRNAFSTHGLSVDLQTKNAKKLLEIGDICVKMITFQGGQTNLFTLTGSLKIMERIQLGTILVQKKRRWHSL